MTGCWLDDRDSIPGTVYCFIAKSVLALEIKLLSVPCVSGFRTPEVQLEEEDICSSASQQCSLFYRSRSFIVLIKSADIATNSEPDESNLVQPRFAAVLYHIFNKYSVFLI
jgi:hypothetical protein